MHASVRVTVTSQTPAVCPNFRSSLGSSSQPSRSQPRPRLRKLRTRPDHKVQPASREPPLAPNFTDTCTTGRSKQPKLPAGCITHWSCRCHSPRPIWAPPVSSASSAGGASRVVPWFLQSTILGDVAPCMACRDTDGGSARRADGCS